MKDLAAGERLGRKFTFLPFIAHGRGLTNKATKQHGLTFLDITFLDIPYHGNLCNALL